MSRDNLVQFWKVDVRKYISELVKKINLEGITEMEDPEDDSYKIIHRDRSSGKSKLVATIKSLYPFGVNVIPEESYEDYVSGEIIIGVKKEMETGAFRY